MHGDRIPQTAEAPRLSVRRAAEREHAQVASIVADTFTDATSRDLRDKGVDDNVIEFVERLESQSARRAREVVLELIDRLHRRKARAKVRLPTFLNTC